MDVQLFWMKVVVESCERKTSESETSWNQNNGLWNKVSNIEKKHRH